MPEPGSHERKTHFGFREVPESEKDGLVAGVFHSVAGKYDLMNDLMSLGAHRLWKQFATEASGVRGGFRVLDVAGGTGDMAAKFALRVGRRGQVVIADINSSMLEVGRGRLADQGFAGNVDFVQANAENLPFPENYFDRVSIAFGLRNVTHIDRALASMFRVLKPGGALLVLEFSRPVVPGLNQLYDAYSFNVLPWLGRVVARDEGSYRYLAESIRKHPDQETLKGMMERAGFERVQYFNLTGGIVALHKGYKY
ncbi:ubiquinone biosynthesis methyltransferase UbiE [Sulfuricaulis limicola]|uniref:Ubiquinone/menaquinone biosynthesis C-methyltransferase UbiE n=1 Tax=Sulfuricaulis limicola TaxID=1620215 RepID=A0A1B4XD10_9GAMM|nr:bifunctional demethylmenaquinone methyltransferase/2-methoxy-6-polyprenyl-1,4-benzoquinol methylase UbiE [Sulfuricaulis limicola]BAV32681.1 ubiquinone biosynthesis methyltransferase UbiE [Sulfuricaulis limicola]